MHELSLVQSALDIAVAEARKHGAARITAIRLRVGAMSHAEPDSLRFYLDLLARGTMAEGARLEAERVPLRARCRACRHEFLPAGYDLSCPHCEGGRGEIVDGRDVTMESLEVE